MVNQCQSWFTIVTIAGNNHGCRMRIILFVNGESVLDIWASHGEKKGHSKIENQLFCWSPAMLLWRLARWMGNQFKKMSWKAKQQSVWLQLIQYGWNQTRFIKSTFQSQVENGMKSSKTVSSNVKFDHLTISRNQFMGINGACIMLYHPISMIKYP